MMRFWNGCKHLIYIFLFLLVVSFSIYIAYGALDTLENANAVLEILSEKQAFIFSVVTSLLFFLTFLGVVKKWTPVLERHWNASVALLFLGMMLIQVLMVLFVKTSLRYDHLKIFDTAVALFEKETVADTHFKSYFMKYPNNLPLCFFTYAWLHLASFLEIPKQDWMEFIKLVNVLFMNFGLFFGFDLLCKYRSKRTGISFLVFLAINPLWYLLVEMYYTSTISLAFSMGAVWIFHYAQRNKTLWQKYSLYFIMGILLAVGFKIRATVIITVAAIFLYACLQLKKVNSKELTSFLMAALAFLLILVSYSFVEKKYAGFDPSETGYPTIHWIMMSAQGEGQYNSADDAYTGSFDTKKEKSKAAAARLQERIEDMGTSGIFELFKNKLRVTFSDGTDDYAALFRTMREASFLQPYVNGARSDYLAVYVHMYHVCLMVFLILAFINRIFNGKRNFLDIFIFQICGAYVFYLIWEVDRAYSIPFMLMFLLCAADGIRFACVSFVSLNKKIKATNSIPVAAGSGLLFLFFAVIFMVHHVENPVKQYVVLQDQETSANFTIQKECYQTFTSRKPFNTLDLWVANWDGAANDSIYDVKILTKDGTVVRQMELLGANAPCMSNYTLSFEKITPEEKEETYTIWIKLRNSDCAIKTDFLYYGSGNWDMYQEGSLYTPEEKEQMDLAFAVYYQK